MYTTITTTAKMTTANHKTICLEQHWCSTLTSGKYFLPKRIQHDGWIILRSHGEISIATRNNKSSQWNLGRISLNKTHRYEKLNDAVQHFNVVIFQPAALDCGHLQVLLLLPLGSRKFLAAASRPVVPPPWVVWHHTKGENTAVLR